MTDQEQIDKWRRETRDITKARAIAIDGIKRASGAEEAQGSLLFLLDRLGLSDVVQLFLDKFCQEDGSPFDLMSVDDMRTHNRTDGAPAMEACVECELPKCDGCPEIVDMTGGKS